MTRRLLVTLAAAATACVVLSGCVPGPPPLAAFTPPPPVQTPTAAPLPIAKRLLREARGFVYRVRSSACLTVGSAFDSEKGLVTNRHVAAGSGELQLATWSGSDFHAIVSAISRGPDLALLESPHVAVHPATLDPAPLSRGAKVWVAGYPRGNQLAIRAGKVVSLKSAEPLGLPGKVLEITAKVQHGNSGGPLLNAEGKVVGVVFAVLRRNRDGLAIPAANLSRFLAGPGHLTNVGCI
ncbi:MAG TPA: serine protease [Mycobacteriales bacterium]|nr:serine protease [Mycobacteriales bacterium]